MFYITTDWIGLIRIKGGGAYVKGLVVPQKSEHRSLNILNTVNDHTSASMLGIVNSQQMSD